MIRRFALASAILIAAASATPAMAESTTGDMQVSASVLTTCSIDTSNILAFGTYDPLANNNGTDGVNLDASVAISTRCTSGTSATITLGEGSNAGNGSTGANPIRRLKNGTNHIQYQLYTNNERTTTWGNTAGTGLAVTGSGTEGTITIYAQIPRGQSAAPGQYTDTVQATITY
jgi:spore coat protein U-like protein